MSYNRIISLVPSLTELIIDLGLKEELVGRTRFCIHPKEHVQNIPIVGGTKNPNIEQIHSLKPDYIFANHEENRKEDVLALQKHFHVKLTKIDTIHEALTEIRSIGRDLDVQNKTALLLSEIENLLSETGYFQQIDTAYFIWKNPWMVAASSTYIDSILNHYHLRNVFSYRVRYPEIKLSHLKEKNPKLILLSSEPFPFKEKHIAELRNLFPESQIQLINGEWFSWYGSGMKKAFNELNSWRKNLSL